MSEKTDTSQAFSHRDAARAVKQQLALGMAALGVTFERVAGACDVSASLVKAWADPMRDHCPPAWVTWRLRSTIPALATYLETALEALSRNELRPVAHGLNAQANVLTASLAQVLTVHSAAMTGDFDYDRAEAESLVEVLTPHIDTARRTLDKAQAFIAKSDDRASNVRLVASKGGVR
jgi:hypothetical protein